MQDALFTVLDSAGQTRTGTQDEVLQLLANRKIALADLIRLPDENGWLTVGQWVEQWDLQIPAPTLPEPVQVVAMEIVPTLPSNSERLQRLPMTALNAGRRDRLPFVAAACTIVVCVTVGLLYRDSVKRHEAETEELIEAQRSAAAGVESRIAFEQQETRRLMKRQSQDQDERATQIERVQYDLDRSAEKRHEESIVKAEEAMRLAERARLERALDESIARLDRMRMLNKQSEANSINRMRLLESQFNNSRLDDINSSLQGINSQLRWDSIMRPLQPLYPH